MTVLYSWPNTFLVSIHIYQKKQANRRFTWNSETDTKFSLHFWYLLSAFKWGKLCV